MVQLINGLGRFVDGSIAVALALPAVNVVNLLGSSTVLGFDLGAVRAFLTGLDSRHDEFHTAGFSGAVLAVALLAARTPFPVGADKEVLVVEAHIQEEGWFMGGLYYCKRVDGRDINTSYAKCFRREGAYEFEWRDAIR
jgi:hypothetical protein